MAGVVGCISKKSPTEIGTIIHTMSSRLYHRGKYIHTRIFSLKPQDGSGFHVAIRTCSHHQEDPFIELNGNIGLIDTIPQLSRTDEIAKQILECLLSENDSITIETISKNLYMTNLFAITKSIFSVTRSIDGQRMLYMAKYDGNLFFATERKSLWAIGLEEVIPHTPGQIIILKNNGDLIKYEYVREVEENEESVTKQQEIMHLKKMLMDSFSALDGIEKCGVLFSGGVDSSLAAYISSKIVNETILFTTNTTSSHDRIVARASADMLGIDLIEVPFDPDIVWKVLPNVIYAIETTDKMDVEIALPFFLAAGEAKKRGIDLLISGQGPDELFAGYAKHVRLVEEFGFDVLNDQLRQEIAITHEVNIARDEKAISHCGVTGFFPFIENRFVAKALTLPAEWKIDPGKIPERKLIFRELALEFGIPEKIAYRPKSATQYSSGSSKMLALAIQQNVSELEGLSKKQVIKSVQIVLDAIGSKVGVIVERELREIRGINFQETEAFIRIRNSIHQRLLVAQ